MAVKYLKVRYKVNGETKERNFSFVYDSTMGVTRHEAAELEVIEIEQLSLEDFKVIDVS